MTEAAINIDESPATAPWPVRAATGAVWLFVLTSCCIGASRVGDFSEVVFFASLGGWAAYLALALARKDAFAWRACRAIAVGSVFFGCLMTAALATVVMASHETLFPQFTEQPLWKLWGFGLWASMLIALPAFAYAALGRADSRRWFGV